MADSTGGKHLQSHGPSADGLPVTRLHLWQIQGVRDVLLIITIFGLIWAGYAMRSVTVPLLVALMLAYLFEPLVARLTRAPGSSRPRIVALLLLTVGLSGVLVLAVVTPLIIRQTMKLADDFRSGRFEQRLHSVKQIVPAAYQQDFEGMLGWLGTGESADAPVNSGDSGEMPSTTLPAATMADSQAISPSLEEDRIRAIVREELAARSSAAASEPVSPWMGWVRQGAQVVFGMLGTMIGLGLLAVLIPFYFFFFSVSYPQVIAFTKSLIPVKNRERVLELTHKMDRAVAGFVRGRLVIAAAMGVMFAVGWYFCGVPYAIVLGLVMGAFSIVPYLVGIGLPIAIGLLAINEFSEPVDQRMAVWQIIVWPTVVYVIVQAVETYILTPAIAGKATNLDPVTILVAVLAGGSVGGMYGMILAIPVTACVKILITDVVLPRMRAWAKGDAEDPLPLSGS